ncbi:GNAT family N-acetyltransferase [Nocardioides alcanivorans]|uniref:GNAT family N-acetyltransferase n=1 Tax=Nocardioides alcanivorans TaxID=2897352 RepID=UPI001F360A96|nr:GNAT family N-acetyltransferase [Nocardioides alcanivorans]
MESMEGLHEVGRHLLGPHVVGQRVVVRRILRGQTGPTGGPAFTDTLGVCTSWGEGRCLVQPERGPEVAIAIADIVSGKPVPPRPSIRHRVSDREAEGHSLLLWPDVVREDLGEWVLRSDPAPVGRLLKRANSALAVGDPGMAMSEATAAVIEFYRSRGREPMVQVLADSTEETHFARLGWEQLPGGDALFMIGSVARASRGLRPVAGFDLEKMLAGDQPVTTKVGIASDGPRLNVELRRDGRLVGGGRAALSSDWLGLHALSVEPELRRRGLGRRVMVELVEWGAERGATTLWLHVETDNHAAIALYQSLGMTEHHALRYLVPPVH